MIATIKVLGLRARDLATVAAAARRVVEYVQGGPSPAAGVSAYYAAADRDGRRGPVEGTARGRAAPLVGLTGAVSGPQLERLLLGRHARTGRALVPARGSAGRAGHTAPEPHDQLAAAPDVLPLTQAARIAGVSPRYLRRLAENHELSRSLAGPDGEQHLVPGQSRDLDPDALFAAGTAGEGEGADRRRDTLAAVRDPAGRGRWLVEKAELGRFMAERQPPTVVIGYDLTCSAPKSVSLLWAFGDTGLREDISAALDAGIDAVFAYLEGHGVVGTVAGKNRPGLGLAAASYGHEISRSEEAHLHVHNIIVNAVPVPLLDEAGRPVLDEDGVGRVEWRTLDGEVLLRHVRTAGFVGAAALRHELSRRRGLEWTPVRNGVAELAAFPRGLMEAFSTRTGEVHEEFAQLVDAGFSADAATKQAAQRGSRAAKRVLSDPEVEALQRVKLTETGWTVGQVRALGARRARDLEGPTPAQVQDLFDRLVGPGGLAEQQPMFTQREVHQQIAAWAVDRLDAEQVGDLAARFLADPRIVRLAVPGRRRRNADEDTYTTTELLETEDALMALYRQGREDHAGPPRATVDPALVEQAIRTVSQQLAAQTGNSAAALSEEQGDLVRQLLSSRDLIRVVVGPAGTGKTEAMRAITAALTVAGHTVLGTANGGRQAEELAERVGITSQVVTSWLTLLDHTPDATRVWRPGTVLILDEATQVSTRDAERLLRYATRTGTVVILIGDPAQLGSVGAGGWFPHLIRVAGAVPGLSINQRQTSPELGEVRAALQSLRTDLPAADRDALQRLAGDGRLRTFETREQMLTAVVDDWYTERHQHAATPSTPSTPSRASGVVPRPPGVVTSVTELSGRSRMMAEHHRDVQLLNRAARARLAADGTLAGPALLVAGRSFQVGDEVLTLTQAGHTLVPVGRPASAYIRTGTVGVVTAVHLDHEDQVREQVGHQASADKLSVRDVSLGAGRQRPSLTVLFPGRGEVHVGWDYLTHAFSDGRDGGLDHAYALTAHKAEGSTMPTARTVLADDTSRPGLYVMLSRAKHDLRGYLIRRPTLDANLDDEDWLPFIHNTDPAIRTLLDHLATTRPERLASDHDPTARAAHHLATSHTLAELTNGRRASQHPAGRAERPSGHNAVVLRRAELAAETQVGNAALAAPPPWLTARIGLRPAAGPHRGVWDHAVRAVAIYQARHYPHDASSPLPDQPPQDPGQSETRWRQLRDEAERITERWAGQLPPARQRRFHTQQETIPRERAVAGIHALLDAGRTSTDVYAALVATDLTDVRAGAAVLEHRVQQLLADADLDTELHRLPGPTTPQQEWQDAAAALAGAEAHHLAAGPTARLAAEHHDLTDILTTDHTEDPAQRQTRLRSVRTRWTRHLAASQRQTTTTTTTLGAVNARLEGLQQQTRPDSAVLDILQRARVSHGESLIRHSHDTELSAVVLNGIEGHPQALAQLGQRLETLDAALGLQVDQAAVRLAQDPPAYLTGLLGQQPTDAQHLTTWRRHAVAVEHYRHYVLGLSHGQPADHTTAPASRQALGTRPPSIHLQRHYDALTAQQPVFDLEVAL